MRNVACLLSLAVLLLAGGCSSSVRATATLDEDIAWSDYARVHVRTRNGSVAVEQVPGETAGISGKKWAKGATIDEANARLGQVRLVAGPAADAADTLEVLVESDAPAATPYGASLQIALPAPCALVVETSNGSVRIEQMEAAEVVSSNGSVTLRKIAGDTDAKTSNGSLTLEDLGGACRGRTTNGSVALSGVRGALDIRTSNGRIVARALGGESRDIVFQSSNGSITADLPTTLQAEVEARTSNGSVTVETGGLPVTGQKHSRHAYQAVVNGGGHKLEARTSNGSVRLRFE